jgi:hypothetical protein
MRSDALQPRPSSALIMLSALAAGCVLFASGCVDREPVTAREVVTMPCACGAAVETLSAPVEPSVATTAPRPGTRLQETVSLGYAGDGPLTQIPTRREWWGDRDRGPVAYGGYGYGAPAPRRHGAHAPVGQGFQAPSQAFAAPRSQPAVGMSTNGGGSQRAAPPPAFFPGRAPR